MEKRFIRYLTISCEDHASSQTGNIAIASYQQSNAINLSIQDRRAIGSFFQTHADCENVRVWVTEPIELPTGMG